MDASVLNGFFRGGERVLAAVSGGADSVALMHLLRGAAAREGFELFAAHYEHGIRGEESRGDADFVSRLCEDLGVPLSMGAGDVPLYAREHGMGLELAARELRYAFLKDVKAELNADTIALAHHMDDQAETVMMHILRGSGLRGLVGMRARQGDIARPLLGVGKAELIDYLTENHVAWREDSTNAVADTPRNRLRLTILPVLGEMYPGAREAICRLSDLAAIDDDYLAAQAAGYLRDNMISVPGGARLDLSPTPHHAVLGRALVEMMGGAPAETVARLTALASVAGGPIDVGGGRRAEYTGGALYIMDGPERDWFEEVELPARGVLALGELGRLTVTPNRPPLPLRDDKYRQVLSAKAMEGASVRTRRPGDYIHPLGAPGKKSLSDFFIDKKVDRPLRQSVPLIARSNEVLWAVGVGISQRAALTGDDSTAMLISFDGFKLPTR